VVYGLVDPGFGLDATSAAELVGLVVSLLVVAVVFSAPTILYMRRRHGERARLDVLPGGLVVAVACVAASRLLHFQPGYIYGVLVGVGFSRELAEEEDGRLAALSALVALVGSLLAWLGWAALEARAAGPNPGLVLVVGETALAAVAVSGIESVVLTMVPLRFMLGAKVVAWSRTVWALLFGLGVFVFVDVLLRPGAGYVGHTSRSALVMVATVLAVFGAGSVGFWAYFRFRRPPAAVSAGARGHGSGRIV